MHKGKSRFVVAALVVIASGAGLAAVAVAATGHDRAASGTVASSNSGPVPADGPFLGWAPQGMLSDDGTLAASVKATWDESDLVDSPHNHGRTLSAGGSSENHGPSAEAVLLGVGSAAVDNEAVYWKQVKGSDLPNQGALVQEPSQILVYKPNSAGTVCSGCGWRLVELQWAGWGEQVATGTGLAVPMGGPGTCGYPPKGCRYPTRAAVVRLSEIGAECGQLRYQRVATVVDELDSGYPRVRCDGTFQIKRKPRPWLKPRLGGTTSRALFNRTVKRKLYGNESRRYLHCWRRAQLRFICRGRWTQIGHYDGGRMTISYRVRGWVRKAGRRYTVRIHTVQWNLYGHGYKPDGPYFDSGWGFYTRR